MKKTFLFNSVCQNIVSKYVVQNGVGSEAESGSMELPYLEPDHWIRVTLFNDLVPAASGGDPGWGPSQVLQPSRQELQARCSRTGTHQFPGLSKLIFPDLFLVNFLIGCIFL